LRDSLHLPLFHPGITSFPFFQCTSPFFRHLIMKCTAAAWAHRHEMTPSSHTWDSPRCNVHFSLKANFASPSFCDGFPTDLARSSCSYSTGRSVKSLSFSSENLPLLIFPLLMAAFAVFRLKPACCCAWPPCWGKGTSPLWYPFVIIAFYEAHGLVP